MNIAIIGYGKMGKEIEKIAIERNHNILVKIDKNNSELFDSKEFKSCDVAIEFTSPDSAVGNIKNCFDRDIPIVTGTTAWLDNYNEIAKLCKEQNQTMFYASNYSLGVNILFHLNQHLAKIMNNFSEFEISMEETHHTQKLDAPSGTAVTLANDIISEIDRKDKWTKESAQNKDEIPIKAHRIKNVTGIHKIKYESDIDILEIKHSAKNRKGFALGAVLAAEFVNNKKGIFTMKDLLKF